MLSACLALDRPSLANALADRGIRTVAAPHDAPLLIGDGSARPPVALWSRRGQSWPSALLLVVEGDEAAVIAAIDAGADDAARADASDALIAARAAALIRRTTPRLLKLGDLVIDLVERQVWRAARALDLLPREFRLLRVLADRPDEIVDRATLLDSVCGMRFDPGTNVLNVHVSRLRAKLDRGFAYPMVRTVKGVGYRLAVPPRANFAPDFAPDFAIDARAIAV
ncbi:MAG: winged helix-turn-helix transcriptional regulator [Sphingomonas sp.]|uniref:winged helix-turn-helix domain-containing protein n=1 Tax=Sphingomonas sp. TaxID=28214 RepID=UPI0017B98ACD|nr:winged helix-turn-helix transcriptional regulator [Sphingomonas sp.]